MSVTATLSKIHALIQTKTSHKQRAMLVCIGLLVAYLIQVTLFLWHLPINSDQVSHQTVMQLSGEYGPRTEWSSPDNYFLKYPIDNLANHVFGTTYYAVVAEVLVFSAILFACVALSYYLLVRTGVLARARLWLVCLVGLWTISVGDNTDTLTHANGRNMELGLALLVLVVVGLLEYKYIGKNISRRTRLLFYALLAIAGGAIIYDDPYFLYFILGPLGLLALLRVISVQSWKQLLAKGQYDIWLFIILSGIFYKVFAKLGLHYGLHVYTPGAMGIHFVPYDTLGTSIQTVFGSIINLYDGMFFGLSLTKLASYRALLDAFLSLTIIGCSMMLLRGWHKKQNAVRVLLPVTALLVTAAFFLSSNSTTLGSDRYFVSFLPIFFILLPTALLELLASSERARILGRTVIVAMVLSLALNIGHIITRNTSLPKHGALMEQETHNIKVIDGLNLSKGYADYWDADIGTYLSNGRQVTISLVCTTDKKIQVFYWLMDSAWLSKHADKTFIIQDPTYSTFQNCTSKDLANQFGAPAKVVSLGGGQNLLVYNYDILTKMPARAQTISP